MVPEEKIAIGDIVFVYESPPPNSLTGVVEKIRYPLITVRTIRLDGAKVKYNALETVDLSGEIPISILSDEQQNQFFSTREKKRIDEIKGISDSIDIFSGGS